MAASFVFYGTEYWPSVDVMCGGLDSDDLIKFKKYFFWSSTVFDLKMSSLMYNFLLTPCSRKLPVLYSDRCKSNICSLTMSDKTLISAGVNCGFQLTSIFIKL